MKNTFKLLALALMFVVGHANAKTQAIIVGTDEKPFTLHASGKLDMGGYHLSKDEHGMGMKSLAGNFGFAHYIGHNFEYSLNLNGGLGTTLRGKLFANEGKNDGFRSGANLSGRYLHPLTESIRFGGLLDVGYTRLFGAAGKTMNDSFSFGDMEFSIGPSFMHKVGTMFTYGVAATYGMTEMRFGAKESVPDAMKKYSNLHTVRLPIDVVIQVTENIGVALALEPGWRYMGSDKKFYEGLFYDAIAGVNIGF